MDLIQRFHTFVEDNRLFGTADKLLVAVSGGKDSMLLLTLLTKIGIAVEVAHCNFMLRGEESDGDEALVSAYARELRVNLHIRKFDTSAYAQENKISIQMAARDLRYAWFDELAKERNCKYVAVAQHMNDHVETALLNLTRGTGINGLHGIQAKRDKIIRPLLFLTAKEIGEVVDRWSVPFRDDSSNFSTKYARNKVRLDIIPQFEQINPDFLHNMQANMERFREASSLLTSFLAPLRATFFRVVGPDKWQISKADFRNFDLPMLYALFEPYGFSKSVLHDAVQSMNGETGRLFRSAEYSLVLDRAYWFLRKSASSIDIVHVQETDIEAAWGSCSFRIQVGTDISIGRDSDNVKLDFDKLIFPLIIRSWQEGDTFRPLGMRGTKKLSDFFIAKKISLLEKRDIPIWLNGNGDVIWISNLQIDDRYKITHNTQKVLTLVSQ